MITIRIVVYIINSIINKFHIKDMITEKNFNYLLQRLDYLISIIEDKNYKFEDNEQFMDSIEVLAFLKKTGFTISRSKLYKLSSTNCIPCEHFGRKLIFRKEDIKQWSINNIKNNNKNEYNGFEQKNRS